MGEVNIFDLVLVGENYGRTGPTGTQSRSILHTMTGVWRILDATSRDYRPMTT